MYLSIEEFIDKAEKTGKKISDLMIEQEMERSQKSYEEIWTQMGQNLDVMDAAVKRSQEGAGVFSPTGLTGGDAARLKKYRAAGKTLSGDLMMSAVQAALGTNEVNAAMGVCYGFREFIRFSLRPSGWVSRNSLCQTKYSRCRQCVNRCRYGFSWNCK